jgi:hypothetical protein
MLVYKIVTGHGTCLEKRQNVGKAQCSRGIRKVEMMAGTELAFFPAGSDENTLGSNLPGFPLLDAPCISLCLGGLAAGLFLSHNNCALSL